MSTTVNGEPENYFFKQTNERFTSYQGLSVNFPDIFTGIPRLQHIVNNRLLFVPSKQTNQSREITREMCDFIAPPICRGHM